MKRIKVMLSAILVLGVVGGLFAFKTKSDSVCLYQKNTSNVCTIIVTPEVVADIGAGNQTAIIKPAQGCPATVNSSTCTRKFDFTINP